MWKGITALRDIPTDVLKTVMGAAVPLTWTFLLDAYGFGLLKAGHLRLSRSLLEKCIKDDPSFSSPYVHLAEWYLTYDKMQQKAGSRAPTSREITRKTVRTLAEVCLHLTLKLEGKRNSRISRRARTLLDKVPQ